MYSIACVDDDENIIKQCRKFFESYSKSKNIQYQLDGFTKPLAFTNENKKYDCIFLDIEMKGIDGLSLADSIRTYDNDVLIVFVTHLANLAIEGYRVHAFDFIIKPIEYASFETKMDRIIHHINKNKDKNNTILLNTTEGIHNTDIDSIISIESDKHYLNINLIDNTIYRVYGKLDDFKNKFDANVFVLSGKSYLVNLSKIDRISSNEIIMVNKKIIPITRSYKENFINAFTVYASGE